MAEDANTYRRLKIGATRSRERNLDYLRLLDLPERASGRGPLESPVGEVGEARERPRLLEGDEGFSRATPESQERARFTRDALRNWKLSARLDADLLAELYGAAADLTSAGATVSSLVEEALRLYLPRLRARYNAGRPFAPRGPRTRTRRSQAALDADTDPSPSTDSREGDAAPDRTDPSGGFARSR